MGGYLRQATAQARTIGPFIDDVDFKTLKTALVINASDIKLNVNGGAQTTKNSGGASHVGNALYSLTFDAVDSATVGELRVSVAVAGALIVWDVYTVLTPTVFDAIYAATAALQVESVGSVGSLGPQAKLDVNAEVVDALSIDTYPEPAGAPPATASLAAKINWQQLLARNVLTQDNTTQQVRNDADTATVATAAVSDLSGVTTRGKFV